ncbi:MAG: hypothetical protein SGARI_004795, partial [Bacillariaceae sp.]
MAGDEDSTASSNASTWAWICCLSMSFMLFRMSIDLIQTASRNTTKDYTEDHHNATAKKKKAKKGEVGISKEGYGSISNSSIGNGGGVDEESPNEETAPLVTEQSSTIVDQARHMLLDSRKPATWSFRVQLVFLVLLTISAIAHVESKLPTLLVWSSVVVVSFSALLTYRDVERRRFGIISRIFYLAAALTIGIPLTVCYYHHRDATTTGDEIIVNVMSLFALLALGECFFVALPRAPAQRRESTPQKKRLSSQAILVLLKPYFWPEGTTESATMNRIRAILTWVCVILSKICNLTSPILLGWASTALAHQDYARCIYLSIAYSAIQFFGAVFKEGQSLVYLKVAQAAFIQLSEVVFVHLHQLSLDWHLAKKLGE